MIAIRNYSCKEREKWDNGTDITALDTEANEKTLLRMVESKSESGVIGINAVRKMLKAMEREEYDKGVLFGNRFTDAAKQELLQNNIQIISEQCMPRYKPERPYLRIDNYVNKLCKVKCGKKPQKEPDCKGNCRVRIISDNATYHFEQGRINPMKKDLKELSSLDNSLKGGRSARPFS